MNSDGEVKNYGKTLVPFRFFIIFLSFVLVVASFMAEANGKITLLILKGLLFFAGLFYFYVGIFMMRRRIPSSLETD